MVACDIYGETVSTIQREIYELERNFILNKISFCTFIQLTLFANNYQILIIIENPRSIWNNDRTRKNFHKKKQFVRFYHFITFEIRIVYTINTY